MTHSADSILAHLQAVAQERQRRSASAALQVRAQALKLYQQKRFTHTHADLLSSPRYEAAARFFLNELYGPSDFSQRDAEFARVVPALVRLFPSDVVDTVETLARLHALSEQLDTAVAEHLSDSVVTALDYVAAWQAAGHAPEREMQIALTLSVGASLDTLTRKPLLKHSLRMMRVPARAAGLSTLQQFLEDGFECFAVMRSSREFLETVGQRERLLASMLFDSEALATPQRREEVLRLLPG